MHFDAGAQTEKSGRGRKGEVLFSENAGLYMSQRSEDLTELWKEGTLITTAAAAAVCRAVKKKICRIDPGSNGYVICIFIIRKCVG